MICNSRESSRQLLDGEAETPRGTSRLELLQRRSKKVLTPKSKDLTPKSKDLMFKSKNTTPKSKGLGEDFGSVSEQAKRPQGRLIKPQHPQQPQRSKSVHQVKRTYNSEQIYGSNIRLRRIEAK